MHDMLKDCKDYRRRREQIKVAESQSLNQMVEWINLCSIALHVHCKQRCLCVFQLRNKSTDHTHLMITSMLINDWQINCYWYIGS